MAYDAAYHSAYYQANKAKKRAQAIAWEKANPEKVAEIAKRKAEKIKNDPVALARRKASRAAWEHSNPESVLYRAARNRARQDGLDFLIDVSDVCIPEFCPLLGIRIESRRGGHGPQDTSPSLDRIDNTKGYVKDNVWVVSWLANKMKATASKEQLLVFAGNIQKLFGGFDAGQV